MEALFHDILSLKDVSGVIFLSPEGVVRYQSIHSGGGPLPDGHDWKPYLRALEGIRELDLFFSEGRIYIRRAETGFILVLVKPFGQMAMVRLNCDLLLPRLCETQKRRGFRRLFRFGKRRGTKG